MGVVVVKDAPGSPAGRYRGRSVVSCGLVQGCSRRATETGKTSVRARHVVRKVQVVDKFGGEGAAVRRGVGEQGADG